MAQGGVRDADSAQTQALAEDLRRAIGTFVRAVRERTDMPGAAQVEALGLLDREGAMNVAALADRRGVTHQTMRVIVGQLEASGFVERRDDPADRRSQLCRIVDAGRAELARTRTARASRIGDMIEKALTPDEQAGLRSLVPLLERLSAAAAD